MSHGRPLHRYTYADDVALERESTTKHEFLDGEIHAMAGGSEEYDTGAKLECYQTIATLHEYIIVSHRERCITVHRPIDGGWTSSVAIAGGRITVDSLGAELVVDQVYRGSSIGQ